MWPYSTKHWWMSGLRRKAVTKPNLIFQTVLRPDISKLPLLDTLSLNWIAAIFFIGTLKWEIWNVPVIMKRIRITLWYLSRCLITTSLKGGRQNRTEQGIDDSESGGSEYPSVFFHLSRLWVAATEAGYSSVFQSICGTIQSIYTAVSHLCLWWNEESEDPDADTTPEAEYNAVQWFMIIYKITGSWMARQATGQNQKNGPTSVRSPKRHTMFVNEK